MFIIVSFTCLYDTTNTKRLATSYLTQFCCVYSKAISKTTVHTQMENQW